ncbi:MAG TPA: hypothetical protein VIT45_16745 [Allosphingosinicella sp.]
MARRNRLAALAGMKQVRELQLRQAEMRLAESNDALRRVELRRDEAVEALEAGQQGWSDAVSQPYLSLQMAASWSASLHLGEDALREVEAERSDAESERHARTGDWRGSSARADLVRSLLRSADRDSRRHKDEAALNAIEDRTARGRSES